MTDINNNNNNNHDNSVAIRSNSIILQYVMEHIIPFHEVDIVDAVITVSGMVKAGLINLDTTAAATVNDTDTDTDTDTIDFEDATQFEVNEETKKITRLVLARDTSSNNNDNNETQGNENNNNNNQWELPLDIICRLEMLESLDLSFCGSISLSSTTTNMTNSSCDNLKRLDLQYTYLQQRQQQQQQQHTSSSNRGGGEEEDDNNNHHLFDFLPNLECIKFGSYEGEHIIDSVLNDIIQQQHKQKQQQQQGVSFLNKNLHNISFNYCTEFNERHLETILFHILPEASKLTTLDLWSNQIHTVQGIAARIKRTTTGNKRCIGDDDEEEEEHQQQQQQQAQQQCSVTLRCLDLHRNPILERSQTDPMERDALMTILRTFKGICNLGACCINQYHPDIEYLLRINHAGRRLVEGNIDDHDGNNYNSNNNKQPRIPISLWPIILERSYKKSNHIYGKDFRYGKEMKNHDGLFYLIRHGPVLQHIMCIQEENNDTKSTILSRKSS